ncbi:DUF317 domain-containing protein [Streptomyces sp. NPDC093225]|uniref:DUF317 domain-containing protein n=1 Tax=Streptomyces sp. NPDC093225 TaxID=3366034 RepID=UPI003811A4F8
MRAAGWRTESDPLHPKVVLHSPDYSHQLTLAPKPGRPQQTWWRIRGPHGPAYWSAEFSGATPVEIVAGLTDALVQPPPGPLRSPFDLLTSHGWRHHREADGSESAASPDEGVSMEWQVSPIAGTLGWAIEAVDGGFLWRASLDDNTPSHLVTSFARALANPDPVLRGRFEIPYGRPLKQEQEEPLGPKATAAHAARLAQARRHRPKAVLGTSPPGAPALPRTASPARSAR